MPAAPSARLCERDGFQAILAPEVQESGGAARLLGCFPGVSTISDESAPSFFGDKRGRGGSSTQGRGSRAPAGSAGAADATKLGGKTGFALAAEGGGIRLLCAAARAGMIIAAQDALYALCGSSCAKGAEAAADARANAAEAARSGAPEAAIATLRSGEPTHYYGLPSYRHHFHAATLLMTLAIEGVLSEAQRKDALRAVTACQRRGLHMRGVAPPGYFPLGAPAAPPDVDTEQALKVAALVIGGQVGGGDGGGGPAMPMFEALGLHARGRGGGGEAGGKAEVEEKACGCCGLREGQQAAPGGNAVKLRLCTGA